MTNFWPLIGKDATFDEYLNIEELKFVYISS